ncbi:MAG: hypothetical protein ACXVIX_11460 [Halobacteriota archaeon]
MGVDRTLQTQEGHAIAEKVRKALLNKLNYLSSVVIVVEPR